MKRWFIVSLAALNLTALAVAEPLTLTVHTDQTTKTISTGIYGQFLEHIFNSVHGGLWGDKIRNGTLELIPPRPPRRGQAPADAPAPPPRAPEPGTIQPQFWELTGAEDEIALDRDNPFNADISVRLTAKADSTAAPSIRQDEFALKNGEKYTLTLYARGSGDVITAFEDGEESVYTKTLTGLTPEWQKFTVEFTAPRTVNNAALRIGVSPSGTVNIDQVSLFSASALANGGYRPDLMKAVADLQPDSIRWPGGSFASRYEWKNAIGPREKRLPHPMGQWGERDTYQFGTDEFMQFCAKVGAEPIPVINTRRGVEDALEWLDYMIGDSSTEYGRLRAANGHPEPYDLKTIELDNETWRMGIPGYLEVIRDFLPAIRARYPQLKLSVVGSYGYDTGVGQSDHKEWDRSMIEEAGTLFDILSPHYYNGIYTFEADFVDDPYNYEQFLKTRGDIIRQSENPNIIVYVSEWNLTEDEWGNDWRVGLYAGGILNGFERQADIVKMTCPALFLRRDGVTDRWDNALINFDQYRWYGAGNYWVMKLWRDSFAPNLLAVEGPDRPLNFVATRSADKRTVFLKAVNPTDTAVEAEIRLEGDLTPSTASFQLIAPGGETVRNTIDEPDNIKVVPGTATVENGTVKFTMPPLSAGVVKVN